MLQDGPASPPPSSQAPRLHPTHLCMARPLLLQSGEARSDSPYCGLASLAGAICVADSMHGVSARAASSRPCTLAWASSLRLSTPWAWAACSLEVSAAAAAAPPAGAVHRLLAALAGPLPADEGLRGVQRALRQRHRRGAVPQPRRGAQRAHHLPSQGQHRREQRAAPAPPPPRHWRPARPPAHEAPLGRAASPRVADLAGRCRPRRLARRASAPAIPWTAARTAPRWGAPTSAAAPRCSTSCPSSACVSGAAARAPADDPSRLHCVSSARAMQHITACTEPAALAHLRLRLAPALPVHLAPLRR